MSVLTYWFDPRAQPNAFINDVAAQAQNQVITAAPASSLTNAAMSIKKALGCA